jgi:hypothetical protein
LIGAGARLYRKSMRFGCVYGNATGRKPSLFWMLFGDGDHLATAFWCEEVTVLKQKFVLMYLPLAWEMQKFQFADKP